MGEWILRKPEPTNIRGICVACGLRQQKKSTSKSKKKFPGQTLYLAICTGCRKRLQKKKVWIIY